MSRFIDKKLLPDFGEESKNLIWNTELVDDLLDKIENHGLSLDNTTHPFYDKNPELRKGRIPFQLTDDEFGELLKCKKDIIYFANNYVKLLTPDGTQKITLRDYQVKMLNNYVNSKTSCTLGSRQIGKCFSLNTKIKVRDSYIVDVPVYQIWWDNLNKKTIFDVIKYGLYWLYDKLDAQKG